MKLYYKIRQSKQCLINFEPNIIDLEPSKTTFRIKFIVLLIFLVNTLREGASRLCNLPLIPQPLLPKKGEGETDSKSLSRLGRGI
jgi:hypothetical protein